MFKTRKVSLFLLLIVGGSLQGVITRGKLMKINSGIGG